MSTIREERELVETLSSAQLIKLRLNKHKPNWKSERTSLLLALLRDEVAELEAAVNGGEGTLAVWLEAADVANLAAMIADR